MLRDKNDLESKTHSLLLKTQLISRHVENCVFLKKIFQLSKKSFVVIWKFTYFILCYYYFILNVCFHNMYYVKYIFKNLVI